jgi:hypothetical protein
MYVSREREKGREERCGGEGERWKRREERQEERGTCFLYCMYVVWETQRRS